MSHDQLTEETNSDSYSYIDARHILLQKEIVLKRLLLIIIPQNMQQMEWRYKIHKRSSHTRRWWCTFCTLLDFLVLSVVAGGWIALWRPGSSMISLSQCRWASLDQTGHVVLWLVKGGLQGQSSQVWCGLSSRWPLM